MGLGESEHRREGKGWSVRAGCSRLESGRETRLGVKGGRGKGEGEGPGIMGEGKGVREGEGDRERGEKRKGETVTRQIFAVVHFQNFRPHTLSLAVPRSDILMGTADVIADKSAATAR